MRIIFFFCVLLDSVVQLDWYSLVDCGNFLVRYIERRLRIHHPMMRKLLNILLIDIIMNQSILASRAKLISVNLKIPLTASLKDFEFF